MNKDNNEAFTVGYGKPPAAHRFQKGKSGNPRGRPRKAVTATPTATVSSELDDLILREALRPITLRENNETITLPMIQAVLRSLGVSAVKGNHKAQLAVAQMVKEAQAAKFEERSSIWTSAVDYKDRSREVFAEADRRGVPRPEPVPHPDDIVLDSDTMTVRFNGPMTEDEKAEWDRTFKRIEVWKEEADFARKQLRRSGKSNDIWRDELEHADRMIKLLSAIYPTEQIRRQPGFDIQKWRQRQPVIQELLKKRARRKPRATAKG